MDKSALLKLISAFPQSILENVIIAHVRELFFNGDWGSANAIIEHILANNECEVLHGKIACFGIFTAVRARDLKKALDRFDYLDKLDKTDANLGLLADGLFHLSDLLLPDQPSFLADLWKKEIRIGLPALAQEKYARIGVMLHRQFMKDCDTQQCENITEIMKSCLDEEIFTHCRGTNKIVRC